ncbi:S-adenosylmethionine:tRNA ribosyltransferase-isomerase [Nocardia terpenica]|uniref:S-adenosylmethionine:tRNA ribosyltransferase-isomerase n=1 Tax=Nocardia terpenica TaxID=455432 RepID=UPI001894F910|nr:S-adenosylmethionine:tRNA ribosyltransferase-isomerase [Nocardia terpenica]MBF6064908.1 S-adenosylmethionine:tRNA ribosyltransferase-isomerase [Nocardia terpenica]MBF6107423.1 S-adenosylmethionine:tRNA ribosyltransferase-isomerase [Nocardia terpenica]MBF6115180.1 S-adenosylmethionine:tRNA ribosyltransferase-isomerase [Nocardia terpenica]MBF6122286.1 S-adenosylmethionine:tRNA ribosyltransferase-isomerase [Nocardia terpenica]MBF6154669.1 S-adenosylmethionine:tRNA ribosyltransferase-isomerase 
MTVILENFALPADRAATEPPEARGLARDDVRMLVSDNGVHTHARFRELPRFLRPGDLVVVNNSATLNAAVDAHYLGRPAVLHFAARLDDGGWVVELRDPAGVPFTAAEPKPGRRVLLAGTAVTLRRPWLPPARRLWIADPDGDVPALLARHGRPITYSYVAQRWSPEYYRTVFGREPGSAEMPSAGRPFTDNLVTDLVAAGVTLAPITLHTGVSSPETGEPPSPERYTVPEVTARLANATHATGGRVIAVGTTVTRALESATVGAEVHPSSGWTDLILDADHPTRSVDALITGWHEPGASHLHLLEAVAGTDTVRDAYEAALDTGYLWHEFGDTALLFRPR